METKLQNIKTAEEEKDRKEKEEKAMNRIAEESRETVNETKDERVGVVNETENTDLRRKRGKRKSNYFYRPEEVFFDSFEGRLCK